MRKLFFVLLAAAALVALTSGVALANFGPHGGYASDTDQCAACHRAHTSFSTAKWSDWNGNQHNALLVSNSSNISQFCDACHGNGAPGASTDVVAGVFEGSTGAAAASVIGSGGPSAASGVATVGAQLYLTDSTDNGPLNGGAFAAAGTTSVHNMDNHNKPTDPMWGFGDALHASANLTCTDCHDPHGSSNYRLLRDTVNKITVGGYDSNNQPAPFVISNEVGYPQGGWLKGDDGARDMAAYRPAYTGGDQLVHLEPASVGGVTESRSISAWCAGCHTQYNQRNSSYDYLGKAAPAAGGSVPYDRHPVDITLAAGAGPASTRALAAAITTNAALPLEYSTIGNNLPSPGTVGDFTTDDYLGCLTCHFAHGTTATMSGWASATTTASASTISTDPVHLGDVPPMVGAQVTGMPFLQTIRTGTNPNNSSSLLRMNNRGVCEACHNK